MNKNYHNYSLDLREQLNSISVSGLELRQFLEKVLERMVEIEDSLEDKANKTEDGAEVVYKYPEE